MDKQCYNRLKELCNNWDRTFSLIDELFDQGFEAGMARASDDLNKIIDDETNSNI